MAHHKSSKHKNHKRKHKSKQKGSTPAGRFAGAVTPILSQWQASDSTFSLLIIRA